MAQTTRKLCFSPLFLVVVLLAQPIYAQRVPIPEGIAKGAVGSVATVPSGQVPTVNSLLKTTDLVVTATIGEPRSYLSDDQRDVYTDYSLINPVVLYSSHPLVSKTPGTTPNIVITQLGGTVVVAGTAFTQKEPALPPLQSGTQGLFLLEHIRDKYVIAGKYFGAFAIKDGTVNPLMVRDDFAPDFRNIAVSEMVQSVMGILGQQQR